jgi:hypothetical protein
MDVSVLKPDRLPANYCQIVLKNGRIALPTIHGLSVTFSGAARQHAGLRNLLPLERHCGLLPSAGSVGDVG